VDERLTAAEGPAAVLVHWEAKRLHNTTRISVRLSLELQPQQTFKNIACTIACTSWHQRLRVPVEPFRHLKIINSDVRRSIWFLFPCVFML
jgi:hypothetical protein